MDSFGTLTRISPGEDPLIAELLATDDFPVTPPASRLRSVPSDAPFASEHAADRPGLHHVWIPLTTPTDHITSLDACRLTHRIVRTPSLGYSLPPILVSEEMHEASRASRTVSTSADPDHAPECTRIFDVLGTDDLVDARPALRVFSHPAALRETAVWAATPPRAFLEHAWVALHCPDSLRIAPLDIRGIADRLWYRDEWERVHILACLMAPLARTADIAMAWEDFCLKLTPRAASTGLCTDPDARWSGIEDEPSEAFVCPF